MGIGLSTGEYYEDEFAYSARNFLSTSPSTMPTGDSQEPAGAFKSDPGREVAQNPATPIDRDHHVPLVASAIMDQDGKMSGMAIDHRVPENKEYEPFLALHEGTELPLMQNYIKDGYSNQDAYHKAHDIATATESAAVRAHAIDNGHDPDEYQDKYKQFYRDAASIASEPTDKDRHPDAHTTRYGLDEAELGKQFPSGNTYTGTVPVEKTVPQKLVEGLYHQAKDLYTLPGDALHGDLKPGEEIPRAADLAMAMVGGPSAFAGKLADGTLGSFAGVKAATADKEALATAQNMADKGFGKEAIWSHTGWFEGNDGKWRYELDSSKAQLKALPEEGGKLPDILHYPDLYKAYPELKNIDVKPIEEGREALGSWDPNTKSIKLKIGHPESRFILLHEVQHAIQKTEGFERGSSPSQAMYDAENFLHGISIEDPAKRGQVTDMLLKMWGKNQKSISKNLYNASPGEQEANVAAGRSEWGTLERRNQSPITTLERNQKLNPKEWPAQVRYPK